MTNKSQGTTSSGASIKAAPPLQGAQKGAASSQNQGLPPSGTFNLWQMLMAIMKYEKMNLDSNAELQKNWATALGGANGVFAKLYNVGISVGDAESQSLKDQAFGQFAGMGVSLGALGLSAGDFMKNTRPALNEANGKLTDLGAMRTATQESQAGISIGGSDAADAEGEPAPDSLPPPPPPPTEGAKARIKAWSDGSESIENFGAVRKDGTIDGRQKEINEAAAYHATGTEKEKIMKKIEDREESLQRQKKSADEEFHRRSQIYTQVSGALEKGASGGASLAQAHQKEAVAKANATNTLTAQVQQQMTEQERKAQQNSQEALQSMSQWANSFAQAAASQVHG